MDFSLSAEQQLLQDTVTQYCKKQYDFESRMARVASDKVADRTQWKAFADLGWLGAGLPEELGGYGGSVIDNSIICEQFGHALVLEPFISSAVLSCQILASLPVSQQTMLLLEKSIAGDTILATAHSEPAARGNLQHTETRATPHKGEWRLNGKKSLVVGLSIADHVIVSANTDEGAALFLVDAEAIQSQIKPYRTIDNALAGDLCLENTPSSVKLSGPEHTMRALANGFADALICLCSEAVGAMDTALFLTRDYLKLRQQFGSSLNNFQSLQHRMAEMLVELELSRSIVYHGIASSGMSDPLRSRAISAMKALVSSAALFVGANAVQLHGAIGMTEEYSIGHYYKRLRVISHLYGNEDTHLKILSTTQGSFWDEGVHQH